jgi:cytochrome c-type biogenesis protein CcmH
MRRIIYCLVVLVAVFGASQATAWVPSETLPDPVLEKRARALSAELRCLVCQNQSIDDSDAGLAKDLRLLVRERLVAGDSDDEVLQYLVGRYGEFILLRPRLTLKTAALWGTPVLLILLGGLALIRSSRKPRTKEKLSELDAEERARLDRLLREQ